MQSKQLDSFSKNRLEKDFGNSNYSSSRDKMSNRRKAEQYETGLQIQRQRELENTQQKSVRPNTSNKEEITPEHIEQYIQKREKDIIKNAYRLNMPAYQYRQIVRENITNQIAGFRLDNGKLDVRGYGGVKDKNLQNSGKSDDPDHISVMVEEDNTTIELPPSAYTHDEFKGVEEAHDAEELQNIKPSEWIQKTKELFYTNQKNLGAQNGDQVLLATMEQLSLWAEKRGADNESILKELNLARKLIQDMHKLNNAETIHQSVDEIASQLKTSKKLTKVWAAIGAVGTIATIIATTYTVEMAKHSGETK